MLSRKITILLVDDHEVVRQGLKAYLDAQPDFKVIGEASSGEEAVEAAMEFLPDVMLMDLVMSGIGGVEATRRVKDVTPRTQIVVLTSYHQDEFIFSALQAGAISYVLKDVMMDDLAEAIRKASTGGGKSHQGDQRGQRGALQPLYRIDEPGDGSAPSDCKRPVQWRHC